MRAERIRYVRVGSSNSWHHEAATWRSSKARSSSRPRCSLQKHSASPRSSAVCSELDTSDRELLQGISAVGWYPIEPILRYHHVLERLYGNESTFEVCERLGQFSAEWAIKGILKIFVRFKSPHFLMQKNGTLWGRYHDTGRWADGSGGTVAAVRAAARLRRARRSVLCTAARLGERRSQDDGRSRSARERAELPLPRGAALRVRGRVAVTGSAVTGSGHLCFQVPAIAVWHLREVFARSLIAEQLPAEEHHR